MTHHCHALACNKPCKPEFLMCGRHWALVPKDVQRAVYAAYRPGQCQLDPLPSEAWHEAADLAIVHVAILEGVTISQRRHVDIFEKLIAAERAKAAPTFGTVPSPFEGMTARQAELHRRDIEATMAVNDKGEPVELLL